MSKIIVLEGIECSGKSTYLDRLRSALCDCGFRVYGYSKDSSEIDFYLKVALQSEAISSCEKLLMMFVRYLEKERIVTNLQNQYDFILLDRYDLSMKVFAGMLGLEKQLEKLFQCFSAALPIDLYLYLPLSFQEFCRRGGLERSSVEGVPISHKWFENKLLRFEESFSSIKEKKMRISVDYSVKELVDLLCSDMY